VAYKKGETYPEKRNRLLAYISVQIVKILKNKNIDT
jgi:hypothetical protein